MNNIIKAVFTATLIAIATTASPADGARELGVSVKITIGSLNQDFQASGCAEDVGYSEFVPGAGVFTCKNVQFTSANLPCPTTPVPDQARYKEAVVIYDGFGELRGVFFDAKQRGYQTGGQWLYQC